MKRFSNILAVALMCLTLSSASIAEATTPKDAPPKDSKAKVLWDSWYTVMLNGKVPYGYYNDRVEKKDGKIAFKNQFWKKEEGFINEEQLVAFAEDNADLTPVFFNFHSSYRETEIVIDGTVKDGKFLNVKSRKNGKDISPVSRSIPNKAFFSSLFPVWFTKHVSSFKPKAPHSFTTIMEDNLDRSFAPVSGILRLEDPDEFSKSSKTTKLSTTIENRKSIWYLSPTGDALRIEFPDQHTVVNRVTEAIARRFLIKTDDEAK